MYAHHCIIIYIQMVGSAVHWLKISGIYGICPARKAVKTDLLQIANRINREP